MVNIEDAKQMKKTRKKSNSAAKDKFFALEVQVGLPEEGIFVHFLTLKLSFFYFPSKAPPPRSFSE